VTPERRLLLEQLSRRALALPPYRRAAFLELACGENAELRRELELLLAAHEQETGTLDLAAPPSAARLAGAVEPLASGQRVGRYEVLGRLGAGGMGEVYLARDPRLGRRVALKLLPPALARERERVRRFEQEARAASALSHPYICAVYDVGEAEDGRPFIVMEHVEGETLRQRLARGPLPLEQALAAVRQAAEALGAAHRAGIVHRDLKPENLMLRGDGYLKVLDFGLAKLLEARAGEGSALEGAQTAAGVIVGTVRYMSPEQARGQAVDARTDVWSLGAVLYELVSGRPPFAGETAGDLVAAILLTEPEPLAARDPAVPAQVERVVARALDKAAGQRFASGGELARELKQLEHALEHGRLGAGAASRSGVTARLEPPAESFAAQAARPRPPTNLPPRASAVIGRERELEEVTAKLRGAGVRLLTLTGPGGTGKTHLAQAAARALRPEFEGGAFFVDLSAIRDPALVVPTVARVLGVREAAGAPPEEYLVAHLLTRSVLLVLDNFEQVVEAAPAVARVVDAAPRLKVLVTSRALLHLSVEHEVAVPPLDLPPPGRVPAVEELGRYPAVALFVERGRAARKSFALTERNADAIAAICRRLDGLPLALELAAARLKMLSPEGVLARLNERLKLLTTGGVDLPERQKTMRAAVAWSYDLLDEGERRIFRQLAVFEGGGMMDEAEAVCGGEQSVAVLDAVTSLVDKSLLDRRERSDGDPRFTMLEVVREYARERLAESGEAKEVERRHADSYFAFVETAEPGVRGADAAEWLDRLEAEHENIRRALETYLRDDPDRCLRLASALSTFWALRGHATEGRRWMTAALERGRGAPAEVRVKALYEAGSLAVQQGDLEAACEFAAEVIRVGEQTGDRRRIAAAHYTLGNVAVRRGDLEAARTHLERSLALSRQVEHVRLTEHCLNSLGEVARLAGDLAAARDHYEQAATLVRRTGDRDMLQIVLNNMAAVALEEGDLDAAKAHYGEALTGARGVLSKAHMSLSLDGLAAEAAARGAWRRVGLLLGAAEALREGSGFDLEPVDRALRDRSLAAAREHLGEAASETAMADGRVLSLEQVLRLALEEVEG
jgi:non-specific serine/threonine protein kinase